MVRVKFLGAIQLYAPRQELWIQADDIEGLIDRIAGKYPELSRVKLNRARVYLNGKNISGRRVFRCPLHDGDEVVFFSTPQSPGHLV